MKRKIFLVALSGALVALSGCSTQNVGGSDYTASQVRGEQTVQIGTVMGVHPVSIQGGGDNLFGTIAGGVAGAALGHVVGQGVGNMAATALGAMAGAGAGNAIEASGAKQNGVQVTIRLDSGYVVAVTQGADEKFTNGERVQVLGGAGATRVTALQ
jgi:outer membrane lipoprotein SlyB